MAGTYSLVQAHGQLDCSPATIFAIREWTTAIVPRFIIVCNWVVRHMLPYHLTRVTPTKWAASFSLVKAQQEGISEATGTRRMLPQTEYSIVPWVCRAQQGMGGRPATMGVLQPEFDPSLY